MLPTLIIVFREVLEAALVVSIVMAATKGAAGRGLWVAGGIGVGVAASFVVAAFAEVIAGAAAGMGQEVFNAGVLFAAVAMLGWHNVWMGRHGREIAHDMKKLGGDVMAGSRPLYALAVVVALAVLREGSEVVLFLYGIAAAAGGGHGPQMLTGGALGLAAGAAAGAVIYFGLVRLPVRHLFTVTSWMILLLAAGMASQAAAFLAQADLLPALGGVVWDTSAYLSERSVVGQTLHVLVGYAARPTGIQLAFYATTLVLIGVLMRIYGKSPSPRTVASSIVGLIAGGVVLTGGPHPAAAGPIEVFSPAVEQGELELEYKGTLTNDNVASKDGEQVHKWAVGYGFTNWWFSELEFETEKPADERALSLTAVEWENVFQLAPQGKYWVDPGFFAEYEVTKEAGKADEIKFGPILRKRVGRTLNTVNAFFKKEIGKNSSEGTEFEYGWETRWLWKPWLEPGFQAFGAVGELNEVKDLADQDHKIGPVVFGALDFGNALPGKLKYEAGYLFGLTDATADGTFRWKLEYEFRF